MLPMWVYVAVAALIAALAFVVGQLVPGLGVPAVALGSTLWTAYAVRRQQRVAKRRC